MSNRIVNLKDRRDPRGPRGLRTEIQERIDRELLIVLIFPCLVLAALAIGLLRYANLPQADALPAPAVPVPAPVTSSQRRTPETPQPTTPTTPAAPHTPTPQPQPGQRTYRVAPGDTLAQIALRHGVDYQRIASDNQLPSPQLIHPGQLLRIGTPTPGTRLIRPGDTLTALATQTGLTIPQLLALNPWITNPNHIPAGAGLRVHA